MVSIFRRTNEVEAAERLRGWSIPMTTVLAGGFGVLIAIAVIVVLGISVGANFRNTFSLLTSRATMQLSTMEDSLRTYMDAATATIETISRRYSRGDFSLEETELKATLTGALVATKSASMIAIVRGEEATGVIKRPKGVIEFRPFGPLEESEGVKRVMQRRRSEDGTYWSDYLFIEDRVWTNVSTPLRRDGEVVGYIVASVPLRHLSDFTARLGERFDTTAFILDGDEGVIAHSIYLQRRKRRQSQSATIALKDIRDPVLARYTTREAIRPLEDYQDEAIEFSEIRLSEEAPPHFLMTKKVEGYGVRPWVLGVYYPANELDEEFFRILYSIIAGLIALAVAVLVAWWLGRRISKPIKQTATEAQLVSTLDLEHVEPLPRSRVRELDEQASAFNSMLVALRAFTTYVPRALVAKLVNGGDEAANSREADLTVMFTDIAGFTTLSESMPAAETAALLNRHFEIVCSVIAEENGTVDKFLGDGVMAFWGAPDDMSDHASAAVRTALKIKKAIELDNRRALREGEVAMRMRIGIHSGPVIVGNIGAFDRVNYTIVGDTVNVAQRLEAMGKDTFPDAEVVILASSESIQQVSEDIHIEPVGDRHIRGRHGSIQVFRIGGEGVSDHGGSAGDPEPMASETVSDQVT